jgi:hypothetical protein
MKQLKRRKDLFWLMVSVRAHLTLLSLGLWRGRASWQEGMAEESFSAHSRQETERGRREGQRRDSDNIQPPRTHPGNLPALIRNPL